MEGSKKREAKEEGSKDDEEELEEAETIEKLEENDEEELEDLLISPSLDGDAVSNKEWMLKESKKEVLEEEALQVRDLVSFVEEEAVESLTDKEEGEVYESRRRAYGLESRDKSYSTAKDEMTPSLGLNIAGYESRTIDEVREAKAVSRDEFFDISQRKRMVGEMEREKTTLEPDFYKEDAGKENFNKNLDSKNLYK